MGVVADIDAQDLAAAGWGIILPAEGAGELRDALAPLLERRRAQAGEWYRELEYRPGETPNRFLARYRVSNGPVDPRRGVPYYLLVVGEPEAIPLSFQSQLDLFFAVGRLCFDTPAEYRAYAERLVAAEERPPAGDIGAVVVAPASPDDRLTEELGRSLAGPLAEALAAEGLPAELIAGAEAGKRRLLGLLEAGPAKRLIVFTGHGVGFANGDPQQREGQGALLCADWPGPQAPGGPLSDEWYLSGTDIGPAMALEGTVALLYASYSAATPQEDSFVPQLLGVSPAIAPRAFVSRLAQRLLGAGAFGVIGAADRIWGGAPPELAAELADMAGRLLGGQRVGHALDFLSILAGGRSMNLAEELEEIKFGKQLDPAELVRRWVDASATRTLLLMGDPAAQLDVEQARPGGQRRVKKRY